MKAIQVRGFGSFDKLEYVDVEMPSPAPGQVLVRIVSASVNFADTMLRKGTYPVMPPLPTVPGLEASGVVESIGEQVTQVRPGQRVVVMSPGCYAEYVVAGVDALAPIPVQVDLDVAATLPVAYGTAYHILHTMAQVKPGQTILLRAPAGGVGTAMIQLAKRAGAMVIGITGSEQKAHYAKRLGCDHVINRKTDQVVQKVKEITEGRGVDFALNSVAGDTFEQDFKVLRHFGQLIWFGAAGGPPQGNLLEQLVPYLASSVGIRFFSLQSVLEATPTLMRETVVSLLRDLAARRITPSIQERIPLSEAGKAHQLLEAGAVMGKLVLKPQQ